MGALELSNQRQNCFKGNTGETAEMNRMEWARASKSTVYMYLKVSNWTVIECEAGWEYYKHYKQNQIKKSSFLLTLAMRWGTADAEIKDPHGGSQGLWKVPYL